MKNDPKIIVAIDASSKSEAQNLVSKLNPELCRIKIGSTLFTKEGPALIESFHQQGFEIFLDLKFHDIPQQVAGACQAAAELGVWMVNVHVVGGITMMKAAREALSKFPAEKRPLLIGVTVLTSLNESDLSGIGIEVDLAGWVLQLANAAKTAQLDGVVCSPQEISLIRKTLGKDFLLVTPGIRLETDYSNDQKRILTPKRAIDAGSNYLVIGRPITESQNPKQTLETILETLND